MPESQKDTLVKIDVRMRCRYMAPEALQTLEWIMKGMKEQLEVDEIPVKERMKAAELVLAYAAGRPPVAVDITTREKVRAIPPPPPKPGELVNVQPHQYIQPLEGTIVGS